MSKSEYNIEVKKLFNYGKHQSIFSTKFWTMRGWSEEESKEKVRDIQKSNSDKFVNKCKEGTINHNWSRKKLEETYSEEDVTKILKNRALAGSIIKIQKLKQNPEKYYHTFTTRLEYYLHKGMSIEESESALKNRQKTFSLDICLEKYGKTKGQMIFDNRQYKWLSNFNKNNRKDIERKKKNTRIKKRVTNIRRGFV